MSEILKIGIPTLLFQVLASMSISMINNGAKEYGGSALAAMGPVTKIMSMGTLIVFGFLKGFQPIAGFSYGAKKFSRLYEAIKTSVWWSTIFCAAFGLITTIFPSQIMAVFIKEDMEMIRIGAAALRANGLSFVLFSVSCNGESKRGLLSWRLPAGNLFYAGYLLSARDFRTKWRHLCPACC